MIYLKPFILDYSSFKDYTGLNFLSNGNSYQYCLSETCKPLNRLSFYISDNIVKLEDRIIL